MAQFTHEVSRTFSEYLLIPGTHSLVVNPGIKRYSLMKFQEHLVNIF